MKRQQEKKYLILEMVDIISDLCLHTQFRRPKCASTTMTFKAICDPVMLKADLWEAHFSYWFFTSVPFNKNNNNNNNNRLTTVTVVKFTSHRPSYAL